MKVKIVFFASFSSAFSFLFRLVRHISCDTHAVMKRDEEKHMFQKFINRQEIEVNLLENMEREGERSICRVLLVIKLRD